MTEEMTKYKDKWCQEAYERGKAEATKELQEENKHIYERMTRIDKVLNEKNEQIEKMKCCYNCSKWNDGECKDCPSPIYTMADFNCDKWELAE